MSLSIRTLHEKFPVKEMYQVTTGDKSSWGFSGYAVPKTYDFAYHDISHKFPNEKRLDPISIAEKRERNQLQPLMGLT